MSRQEYCLSSEIRLRRQPLQRIPELGHCVPFVAGAAVTHLSCLAECRTTLRFFAGELTHAGLL